MGHVLGSTNSRHEHEDDWPWALFTLVPGGHADSALFWAFSNPPEPAGSESEAASVRRRPGIPEVAVSAPTR
jgi:hypothetical protein